MVIVPENLEGLVSVWMEPLSIEKARNMAKSLALLRGSLEKLFSLFSPGVFTA